jgi:hypothetical protein
LWQQTGSLTVNPLFAIDRILFWQCSGFYFGDKQGPLLVSCRILFGIRKDPLFVTGRILFRQQAGSTLGQDPLLATVRILFRQQARCSFAKQAGSSFGNSQDPL